MGVVALHLPLAPLLYSTMESHIGCPQKASRQQIEFMLPCWGSHGMAYSPWQLRIPQHPPQHPLHGTLQAHLLRQGRLSHAHQAMDGVRNALRGALGVGRESARIQVPHRPRQRVGSRAHQVPQALQMHRQLFLAPSPSKSGHCSCDPARRGPRPGAEQAGSHRHVQMADSHMQAGLLQSNGRRRGRMTG